MPKWHIVNLLVGLFFGLCSLFLRQIAFRDGKTHLRTIGIWGHLFSVVSICIGISMWRKRRAIGRGRI